MSGSSAILCPVCGVAGVLAAGPAGRPRARCLNCGSLERHRALVGVLPALQVAAAAGHVVDVAPSAHTSTRIEELARSAGAVYLGLDFDPAADNRAVNVQASLTDLPLADASVGVLICFHVLEHIPDDLKAMSEIRRVLAPRGVAVVQVPRVNDRPTDEDPGAPIDERVQRFGQADHVRLYGDDFERRLSAAGLRVHALCMGDLYRELDARVFGITASEPLWLCTSGATLELATLVDACAASARQSMGDGIELMLSEHGGAQQLREELVASTAVLGERLDQLLTERDELAVERDQLRADRDQLRADRDQLRADRDAVREDRDRLVSARDELLVQRNNVEAAQGRLAAERDQALSLVEEANNRPAAREANRVSVAFRKLRPHRTR